MIREEYAKEIDGEWETYIRTDQGGNAFDWVDAKGKRWGNSFPSPDRLHKEEFRRVIDTPHDADTQKLGEKRYTADGENVEHRVVNLDAGELASSLEFLKQDQTEAILGSYATAESVPVAVDGIGNFWADIQSALRLDGARRTVLEAVAAGDYPEGTTVPLTDTDRVAHNLTEGDALKVCLAVAARAQADFSKKQALIVSINRAKTARAVLAITWES